MLAPRPLPLVVSGLVFTALLIGLSMLHLQLQPRGATLLFAALPALVLVVMLLAPRRAALSHFAFPAAHVPLLVTLPELTGDRIYGGPSGLVAFVAVLGAGAAYLVAATPRFVARRVRIEALTGVALVLALAPLLAFAGSALATKTAPWPALTGLLLGPLVAWWLVAHGYVQHVALPALEPALRARSHFQLRDQARPRPAMFVAAAILSLFALSLIAFFYLWSPR
jgi:hypothetical protein